MLAIGDYRLDPVIAQKKIKGKEAETTTSNGQGFLAKHIRGGSSLHFGTNRDGRWTKRLIIFVHF